MGEAKRRKQLGLMPTIHPFEAELDEAAGVRLVRGPADGAQQQTIVTALSRTQNMGEAWASEFRGALALSGEVARPLRTAEDVAAVPVPPLRRVTGDLVLGQSGERNAVRIAVPGGALWLTGQRHSFDGVRWETLSAAASEDELLDRLRAHEAFRLTGEVVAQVRAEHWQEGRIDLDPDPPGELLEDLEELTREWHGASPGEWAELHVEFGGEGEAPAAKRTVFELRRPAPLQSPLSGIFAVRGGLEVVPLENGAAYTHDGEDWTPYPGAGEDELDAENPLEALFGDILDTPTVTATVHADGRVEWPDGELPGDIQSLTTDLREATGAGDEAAWAEWTQTLLRETFAGELAEDASIPVPLAVRLEIPEDALSDPDPLAQTFMESEVTFDGATWRDLFGEDLPPELQPEAN